MTRSIHRPRTARSFSVLELMVAVTISLMLLMGVVALFVSSRASYETTEKLSRIQENGRYALDQIANDIRVAGYQGCSRPVGSGKRREDFLINTLPNPNSALMNFTIPVQGFQGTGEGFTPQLGPALNPFLPPAKPDPAPSGSADLLVLRIPRRDTAPMILAANQGNPNNELQVQVPIPDTQRQNLIGPAVISDCLGRTWFQITGFGGAGDRVQHVGEVNGTNWNVDYQPQANGTIQVEPTNSLKRAYVAGAEIVPLMTVMYYLARPDDNAPQGQFALYRREDMDRPELIAEGIDRMEIRYGVDTTGDGRVDNYVDADDIPTIGGPAPAPVTPNWNAVYSVHISVLARAPEAYGTDIDNQQYTLLVQGPNGVEEVRAGPLNDRFQRKVFTATAALRNQIID